MRTAKYYDWKTWEIRKIFSKHLHVIQLKFMFLSVEYFVILLPLSFENHAIHLRSKTQILAKVPHYLNTANLLQGKN